MNDRSADDPEVVDALDVLERLIGTIDAPADFSAVHDHDPCRSLFADEHEQMRNRDSTLER